MNTLKLRDYTGKALSECTILELYNAALALTQDACRNNSMCKLFNHIFSDIIIIEIMHNRQMAVFHISIETVHE